MAYSYAQLEGYAKQGGFPDNLLPTMAAIAMAESSGINQMQQGQPYSTTGWGLWQITPGNSEPQFGTDAALLDPVNNAKAAFAKYQSQGLGAWTTYSDGAFQKFMQGNVPPDTSGGGGTNPTAGSGPSAGGIASSLAGLGSALTGFSKVTTWLTIPNHWMRIFSGGMGVVLVFMGVMMLGKEVRSG